MELLNYVGIRHQGFDGGHFVAILPDGTRISGRDYEVAKLVESHGYGWHMIFGF